MCGQYSFMMVKQQLLQRYPNTDISPTIQDDDREVYYPGQENIILLPNNKFYEIQWGFIPTFAKRPIINARLESILEKNLFIEPFKKKRCIIPATSFYEFESIEGQQNKKRWRIRLDQSEIFSMAGICERFITKENKSILTYSMLTKESTGQMADIHHRVPVILTKDLEESYLNLATNTLELRNELMDVQSSLLFESL